MVRWAILAGAALALPAAASAQRTAATVIMPEDPQARAFQESVGFADAVISGDTVYLSGVVAGPGKGGQLSDGYERAFKRIATVLQRAGVGWDDVVDITTFHTDLRGHIDAFATVKNRFVKAPFPTWTAIGVSALYEPTAVVEIKVVAKRRGRSTAQ